MFPVGFWAIICKTVRPIPSDRCLSVLSRTLVYCGQTVAWIRMPPGMEVSLNPGHIVLDGEPAPPQKGAQQPNDFAIYGCMLCLRPYYPRPMSNVAGWIKLSFGMGRPRSRPHCVRWGPSSSLPQKGHSTPISFMTFVAEQLNRS